MFILLTTFIATFVALCKGFLVLVGVLLGGLAFIVLLGSLLVAGFLALLDAWGSRSEHTASA